MNPIDTELQHIEELCGALEARLEKQRQDFKWSLASDPAEESAAARLVQQLLDAEKHFAQMVQDGQKFAELQAQEHDRIAIRAALLQKRAQNLLELIEQNAAQCRQLQSTIQGALQELQVGGRFLQSVRGYRENRPRFLDAHQ